MNTEPNVISDDELNRLLAATPAERVTESYLKTRIADVKFHKIGPTLTHCTILLDNGFNVTGESACVNAENYNQAIGEKISYENAFRGLWKLFGFLLAERNKLKSDTAALNKVA